MMLDEFVKDRTNANLKTKFMEICDAIEDKDCGMIKTGRDIVMKLVST